MKRFLIAALAAVTLIPACRSSRSNRPSVQTAPITRQDIVIDAQANGVVEPINVVEVKSKASGLIVKMPVETGTNVKPGNLIAQVDTRDVQNQYNQADADVKAADAKLQVSLSQKRRADEMFKQRVITAQEYEAAALDYANAQAAVVRARASLDLAKQRLEDATVTAPVVGTVIEKTVSQGMVITSATGAFGGGTTLIKMADLTRVRMRAQFNETDIGQIRAGQVATVIVDAYPDRRFQGLVEKIEPQAVVQQGVTMFPVLVTLSNQDGALKPGMNGEVSVTIDERKNVLAVPNDAVKNVREAVATATLLGLNSDSVQLLLRSQGPSQGGITGQRKSVAAQGNQSAGSRLAASPGDVVEPQVRGQRGMASRGPGVQASRDGGDGQHRQAQSQGIRPQLQIGNAEQAGAGQRVHTGTVFVVKGNTYEPRLIMLGAGNFDYTEVISGATEGEEVALLASLSLQAQRQQLNDRFRQGMGGVPGMRQTGNAAGGRGGGPR